VIDADERRAAIVRRPGEGIDRPGVSGSNAQRKVVGADTRGAFALTETALPANWSGPLPHLHENCEESFYVLRGAIRFRLDDEQIDAPAGSFVLIPRGAVHAFWNPHSEPAAMLSIVSPPVLDRFFEDLRTLLISMPPGEIDMDAFEAFSRRHGVIMTAPRSEVEANMREQQRRYLAVEPRRDV
jgi:mannose-6-phosphate isomerase-like protein (cupin superfamily)